VDSTATAAQPASGASAGAALDARRLSASGAGDASSSDGGSLPSSGCPSHSCHSQSSGSYDSDSDGGAAGTSGPCAGSAPRARFSERGALWWEAPPPARGWPLRLELHHSSFQEEEFALWQRYQAVVHRDKPSCLNKRSYCNFLVAHPFRGAFDAQPEPASAAASPAGAARGSKQPMTGTEAGEQAAAQEQERSSPSSSTSAASPSYSVSTSLTDSASSPRAGTQGAGEEASDDDVHVAGSELAADRDTPSCGYGAFHLRFWLGGHFIAVSYVDMLPRCASCEAEVSCFGACRCDLKEVCVVR
jgi:Arginine-tRNA-protein transferase, C terminus